MTTDKQNETLRDKIEEEIERYGWDFSDTSNLGDCVIATIKANVPELVWMHNGNHWAGGHGYVTRKVGSQYTLTIRNQHPQQFPTLEAAQAAAQAHHVAQLTDWMDQ